VGVNTVSLLSLGYARLGVVTSLSGGTINAANGVSFGSGANFVGHGAVNARVAGELGSVIAATGALALGDAASPAGYVSNGELRTRQFAVTLNSSAQAGLGNLTTLGDSGMPGTLNVTNGYVVDFAESLTGFGTVNSTNTLARRAIVNGTVQGNSAAQPITLSGYIKGVGTFDNVTFTGTFDPGLSPALTTVGSIIFGPTNTLIMEIGGTGRGSEYDAILASGNLGLGGTLSVMLINGFMPSLGDSFDLFDWSTVTGTFATLNLPALAAGLGWNTTQLMTSGTLSIGLAGDFNFDGIVDVADYVVWAKGGLGVATTPENYNLWRTNFGASIGPGSGGSTASQSLAPEPGSSMIVLLGVILGHVLLRRKQSSQPFLG
jgi:hypothetical protein